MGSFCESRTGQESALCQYYDPCVRCLIARQSNDTACEKMTDVCTGQNGREFDYDFTNDLDPEKIMCVVRMKSDGKSAKGSSNKESTAEDDICEHYFSYDVDDQGHSWLKIKQSTCTRISVAWMSGLIILATLLFGLVMVIVVKVWFVYHDNRIMAEFEKQKHETTYAVESPIYKSPITKYEVPEAYRRSQKVESFIVQEDTKEYFT